MCDGKILCIYKWKGGGGVGNPEMYWAEYYQTHYKKITDRYLRYD